MSQGAGIAGILDLGSGGGPGGAWEKLCADGARLFAEEDFKKAGEAYTDALSFISLSDRRARAAVLLNRAHAHIKRNMLREAVWDADGAIALSGSSVRSLYTRGLARRESKVSERERERENTKP